MNGATKTRLAYIHLRIWAGMAGFAVLSGCNTELPKYMAVEPRQNTQLSALENLKLLDLGGHQIWPDPKSLTKAIALVFILPDCPICNAYIPELNRMNDELTSQGIQLVLVHADITLTADEAAKHAREYHLQMPVAVDPHRAWIEKAEATMAPEAAVFSPTLELLYRGRINNQYAELGQRRAVVTSHDLREACEAILAGQPVKEPRTQAIGCFIPRD